MSQGSLKRQNTSISTAEDGSEPMDASPEPKRTRIVKDDDKKPAAFVRQSSTRSLQDKNPLPIAPDRTGHVFVFGSGDTGQLGLGDEMITRKKPMPLKVLDDKQIVDVVCGGMHTLAITKDGKLWSWGCNDQRALGRSGEEYEPGLVENLENIKIVKAACGDSVSMALSDDGKLYCWGTYRSSEGALGFSKTQEVQSVPALFEPLKNETIVDIAAGSDHCLALTASGFVYGWGNGQQFQLGRRVIERRKKNGLTPEKLAIKHIKAIGCGSYHSFALAVTGELYVWGLNNYQQCGLWTEDNPRTPDVVTKPTVISSLLDKGNIKSVVAGEHHSLVLMENGEVYAFGRADSSQLGLTDAEIEDLRVREKAGSAHKKAVGIPTRISRLNNIVQIDSGSNHAIAVNAEGRAFTWGFGEMLALGTGDEDDVAEPTLLTGQKLEGHKVLRVAAGAQHSVVLAQPE